MRWAFILLSLVWLMPGGAAADLAADWSSYKSRFLAAEGRVMDPGNGGVSHSEGQGFAMLLAAALADRVAFDALWTWTRTHLRVRTDALAAWRWVPGSGAPDRNNATDGDLLLTWALLRAARVWNEPAFAREAMAFARDIRANAVRLTAQGTILLPGAEGFEHAGGTTVNLSYWVFPALQELAAADPDPTWPALLKNGLRLIDSARFGRWGLPPDWLALTDPLTPASEFPTRYGYEAVRIPLYLYWAGLDRAERIAPFRALSAHFRGASFLPPWVDLGDDSVSSHDAAQGLRAVYLLVDPDATTALPPLGTDEDYYSASLLLLAKLAQRERAAR